MNQRNKMDYDESDVYLNTALCLMARATDPNGYEAFLQSLRALMGKKET